MDRKDSCPAVSQIWSLGVGMDFFQGGWDGWMDGMEMGWIEVGWIFLFIKSGGDFLTLEWFFYKKCLSFLILFWERVGSPPKKTREFFGAERKGSRKWCVLGGSYHLVSSTYDDLKSSRPPFHPWTLQMPYSGGWSKNAQIFNLAT